MLKKNQLIQFAAVLLVSAFFTGCGGLNTMLKSAPEVTYTVTPKPLEMHGDSVEISIKGQYPPKFFNKKAVMEVTPVLKYEGGEKAFTTEKLQGEAVEANAKIIAFETGGTFEYVSKIPYENAMSISELVLRSSASIKDKKIDFPEYKLADGVISTPLLLHNDAQPIVAVDQFKRRTAANKEADIHFAINQANIRNNEVSSSDMKEMLGYVETAKKAENHEFVGVAVSAYASPDGSIELNTKLASKRSDVAEQLMKGKLKKVEEASQAGFYFAESTPEDWDGFKKLMQESSIQDKELILRVLEMNADPVVREKEIKNVAAAYKQIANDILPLLRRSKLVLKVDVVGKSDSLLIAIGKDAAAVDTLSVEEFLRASVLTQEIADQETILTNATNRHAGEWRVFNNLGCVLVNAEKIEQAKTAFQKADELSEGNTTVKNNLGVVEYRSGNQAKAMEYFELATGAGKEVNYNLAIVKVKEGKYQDAVNLFGSNPSFNAALAKLLNGDNDGALKTITEAENAEDPLGYYLKAIIGARTGNTDLIFSNLRTAVTKDASLANKAKKDIEFANYFEDETFKSIVQ
jgi:tetratricopeptide (TPR) repeat protein